MNGAARLLTFVALAVLSLIATAFYANMGVLP